MPMSRALIELFPTALIILKLGADGALVLERSFDDFASAWAFADRVATVSLSRPHRFNAINETMPDDIAAAFNHVAQDDTAHVVVLTGEGKGFAGVTI